MSGQGSDDETILTSLEYSGGKKKLVPYKPYPTPAELETAKKVGEFSNSEIRTIIELPKKKKDRPKLDTINDKQFKEIVLEAEPPDENGVRGNSFRKMTERLKRPPKKKELIPVSDREAESIGLAALTVKRSAIASFGYNVKNFVFHEGGLALGDDQGTTLGYSVQDVNSPTYTSRAYTKFGLDATDVHLDATQVHEAIHIGISRLAKEMGGKPEEMGQDTGLWGLSNRLKLDSPLGFDDKERFVRWIVANKLGDTEHGFVPDGSSGEEDLRPRMEDDQRYQKAYDAMEAAAASLIAKNKPGGPR